MSLVTGVVVYAPNLAAEDEESTPEELALHAYLTGPVRQDGTGDGSQHLERLDEDAAGGYKWIGGSIYAAGFNYVSTADVEAFLAAAPWGECPAVAIIDYEHNDAPIVWSARRP